MAGQKLDVEFFKRNPIGTACCFTHQPCNCAPGMGCRTEAEALHRQSIRERSGRI